MKKCPVCLRDEIKPTSAMCVDCSNSMTEDWFFLFVSNMCIGMENTCGIRFAGHTFDHTNWQEHPAVVKRRVECGTETRMVEYFGFREIEGVVIDDVPGIKAAGLWCPYVLYGQWQFTKPQIHTQTSTEATQATEDRYPHTCPYCGSPAFEGLTIDCTGCNGKGGY